MKRGSLIVSFGVWICVFAASAQNVKTGQWEPFEINLTASTDFANPYVGCRMAASRSPQRCATRPAANTGAFSPVNTRNCASDFCEPTSHTSGKSFTFQRHLDPACVP